MELGDNDLELVFKPITSGLGFHPFSDGMPYAPVSQNQTSRTPQPKGAMPTRPFTSPKPQAPMGTGATAAGAPSFATSMPRSVPRVSVPVAQAAQPHSHPSLQSKTEAPFAIAQPAYGFGYLIKRTLAYLIDSGMNLALCGGALSLALMEQSLQPELLLNPGVILVSVLFFAFFNWAIVTAQEVAFGTSLGKRIFRLAVNGPTSAIFLRAFFFLPSVGFFGVGLLWGILDRRKRCWHDLIVDLQPTEIARL